MNAIVNKLAIVGGWKDNLFGWVLLLISIAIGLFLIIRFRSQIVKFISETKVELAKCTWPWDPLQKGLRRYKELIDSTVVVIISMLLLGAYTSTFDFILMQVTGLITRLHF